MLQSASADTKKATARGNSQPPATPVGLQAPPVPAWSNRAELRLQRKCDCGGSGGHDCKCGASGEKEKKEGDSPGSALHRKSAAASSVLDPATESFFEARSERRAPRPAPSSPPIQIGAVDDPLERQADQIADHVLRMPQPAAPNPPQAGTLLLGRSASPLRRKATGNAASPQAPPIVHDVLRSPGQPLDSFTRNFFEPRFGRDLSQIRIHNDADAAQSAQSVQAHAWALGSHIAFAPGMYSLSNLAGRSLLAHELAHTLQQDAQPIALQRVCDKSAPCSAPISGDSGRFGEKTQLEAEAERKRTPPPVGGVPPGAPTPCNDPRHRTPATSFTSMATGAGAAIPLEVSGIFIDACMPPSAGGYKTDCANFPDGTPPGAVATKDCIAVGKGDEDKAAAILAKPTRSAQDNATVLDSARVLTHEAQHSHFDANATALVPAAADCNLNTVVFHGPSPAPTGTDYDVEFYLSEISAEIAEFAPFFKNFKATGAGRSMESEEQNIVINKGENILGDMRALGCKCECNTVDKFVGQVFADATSSWAPDQIHEFKRSMTLRMPAIWPRTLRP